MMQCDECRIGRLQAQRVPYLDWFGEKVLVAPNTPAWVCDVCGQTHYDLEFLHRLQDLVDAAQLPSKDLLVDMKQVQKRRWQHL